MKRIKVVLKPASVLSALIMILFIPHIHFAQETVVKGKVFDMDGRPVGDAKIAFFNPERGLKFTVRSNEEGKFIKVGIIPAFYKITVEKEGFFPFKSQARIRFGYSEEMEIKLLVIPPSISDDANLEKGVEHFGKGEYDEAQECFERIINKFPENIEGYYNLGLVHLRKEEYDQAIASLEKAKELNPDFCQIHLALGESYFSKEENEKAVEAYVKAIELEPENPIPYYNLGMVQYKLNKTEEALLAFEKCIKLAPDNSAPQYQAGLAAIKHGDYEKAVGYFEKFLEIEPDAQTAGQVKAIMEELKKAIN